MLTLMGRKPKLLLGVDIGSSALKLLELRRVSGGLQLQGYAIQQLPPGAAMERNSMDIDAVSQGLREALARLRPITRNAAVAVPASAVISRCIDMDAQLSDEEMEGQVLLEAEQYIPYPLAEVAIDFECKHDAEGSAGSAGMHKQVRVELTACRKDSVASRVDALQAAGLVTRVVDLESCAMERACTLLPMLADDITAVVDIGATLTILHILQSGHFIYTREHLFGRQQSAEGFARQLERSLQLFFSASGYDHVDSIVLAGDEAASPGMARLISERLGIPITVADPFAHLMLAPTIDRQQLQEHAPALMTACGLAMRTR